MRICQQGIDEQHTGMGLAVGKTMAGEAGTSSIVSWCFHPFSTSEAQEKIEVTIWGSLVISHASDLYHHEDHAVKACRNSPT